MKKPTAKKTETAAERISRIRGELVITHPFFSTFSYMLNLREITEEQWAARMGDMTPTMATDGRSIFYVPSFVQKQTDPQLKFVFVHELLHVILLHSLRLEKRHPEKWNIACDLAINPLVRDAGFEIPAMAALDDRFAGMSAEAIYDRLPPVIRITLAGGGTGKPDDAGGVIEITKEDGSKVTDAERREIEAEIRDKVIRAAQVAKVAGKLPASLARVIGDVTHARPDWRDILRRFVVSSLQPTDYTWARLNRHYMANGIYLPGTKKRDRVGEIVIVTDNSGSIDNVAAGHFLAEIRAILADVKPEMVHNFHVDTEINFYEFKENPEHLTAEVKGGGGTDFTPAFDYIAQHGIRPLCLIYFTDLQCNSFAEAPPFPVLWAHWGGGGSEPPYGEIVSIE